MKQYAAMVRAPRLSWMDDGMLNKATVFRWLAAYCRAGKVDRLMMKAKIDLARFNRDDFQKTLRDCIARV